ncbi:hypothetical protein KUTeg_011622 [Tegillarca granosa]|uniref:PH domain-containing protein n=1 Tax=Tegillarca granosa TaxID=220873 RepID=A0ABQ9EX69_TEGGR|nr:hypothetical protein KUTeg_011622 [Tegillarca granosa]
MSLEIAKAGWLYRQSTILRRWKKTWFVLYQDGDLRYFESPNSHEPEARIVVRAVCRAVQAGAICDVSPPEGKSKGCLLTLVLKDGELKLCAEDEDDMRAWQIALEEARVMGTTPVVTGCPPPYPSNTTMVYSNLTGNPIVPIQVDGTSTVVYPQQQIYTYPGQVYANPYQIVTVPPGQNVVYINQADPYYYRRRYDGTDLALGVGAGAAVGTMMWSTILRRWKKTWFVLYQDGDLRYFESPNSHEPEARIVVRAVCRAVQAGAICDVSPPEGKSKGCLLTLVLKDGELKLCAEDEDDMRAWQIALEEARVMGTTPVVTGCPPPYPSNTTMVYSNLTGNPIVPIQVDGTSTVVYPQQQIYTYPGQVYANPYQIVTVPPGQNVVYINQADPYYYRRRYDGTDLALGVGAGAAVGTMMWSPYLWW